ncbi:hypothetical protein [Paraburkholderia piptadeniae]|nr:hypothetical protein [Paraburkholderia piptadeniae]
MSQWIDGCHFGDCRDTRRAMIVAGVKVQTIVMLVNSRTLQVNDRNRGMAAVHDGSPHFISRFASLRLSFIHVVFERLEGSCEIPMPQINTGTANVAGKPESIIGTNGRAASMVDQYRHDVDLEAAVLDAVPHEHLLILRCERYTSAGHRPYSSFAVLINLSMKAWARRSPYEKAESHDKNPSCSGKLSIEVAVGSVEIIDQKTEYRTSCPSSEMTLLVMTWTSTLKPRYGAQDWVFIAVPFRRRQRIDLAFPVPAR